MPHRVAWRELPGPNDLVWRKCHNVVLQQDRRQEDRRDRPGHRGTRRAAPPRPPAGGNGTHGLLRRARSTPDWRGSTPATGAGGLAADPAQQRIVVERLDAAGAPSTSRSTRSASAWCAPTCCTTAPTSSGSGTCGRCSPARRSGASCSASRAPGPTSPGSRPGPMRDGDEWVVNGQKVWTSLAPRRPTSAARSPAPIPTRRSTRASPCFLVDMHAPGVEVRPLRQMTGDSEFNEVFLDRRARPRPTRARRPRARGGRSRSPRS